jgi:hypothetical protein
MQFVRLVGVVVPLLALMSCGAGAGPAKVGHHAARIGDTNAFIGLAVADNRIAAYVHDGDATTVDTAVWLRGDIIHNDFAAQVDSLKLKLHRDGDRLSGTIEGIRGTAGPVALALAPSDGKDGLYVENAEEADQTTWILVDGKDVGATRSASDDLTLAPTLTDSLTTFTFDRCCYWNDAAHTYACQPAGGSCQGSYKVMRCNNDPPASNGFGECCSL